MVGLNKGDIEDCSIAIDPNDQSLIVVFGDFTPATTGSTGCTACVNANTTRAWRYTPGATVPWTTLGGSLAYDPTNSAPRTVYKPIAFEPNSGASGYHPVVFQRDYSATGTGASITVSGCAQYFTSPSGSFATYDAAATPPSSNVCGYPSGTPIGAWTVVKSTGVESLEFPAIAIKNTTLNTSSPYNNVPVIAFADGTGSFSSPSCNYFAPGYRVRVQTAVASGTGRTFADLPDAGTTGSSLFNRATRSQVAVTRGGTVFVAYKHHVDTTAVSDAPGEVSAVKLVAGTSSWVNAGPADFSAYQAAQIAGSTFACSGNGGTNHPTTNPSCGNVDSLALALDRNDVPWVAFQGYNAIVVEKLVNGSSGEDWEIQGTFAGQIVDNFPWRNRVPLVFDSCNRAYVMFVSTDSGGHHAMVKRFDGDTNNWTTVGGGPVVTTTFQSPMGLAIDSNDTVYAMVVDTSTNSLPPLACWGGVLPRGSLRVFALTQNGCSTTTGCAVGGAAVASLAASGPFVAGSSVTLTVNGPHGAYGEVNFDLGRPQFPPDVTYGGCPLYLVDYSLLASFTTNSSTGLWSDSFSIPTDAATYPLTLQAAVVVSSTSYTLSNGLFGLIQSPP